jgi:hypothetical protein
MNGRISRASVGIPLNLIFVVRGAEPGTRR